jgi:hypothetical protein
MTAARSVGAEFVLETRELPPVTVPPVTVLGTAGSGPAATPAAPGPSVALRRRLALGRRTIGAKAIVVRVQAPAAGPVSLRGSVATKTGTAEACAGHGQAGADGRVTIICVLRPSLLGLLDDKAMRMHLVATYTPVSGPPQVASASIRLPRR